MQISHSNHVVARSDSPGSIDLGELVHISRLNSLSVDCGNGFENEYDGEFHRRGDLHIPNTPNICSNLKFETAKKSKKKSFIRK
jgi:hypothetical protein